MVKCPNCQRENPPGTVLCLYCGHHIDQAQVNSAQTRHFEEGDAGENQPRWGTARFDRRTSLLLRITDSGQLIRIDDLKTEGIIVGRSDPATGSLPDIDLTPYNADELGVSRRHVRLDIHEESLRITDLGSANFTYLNGLRLTANQPRILRDGDQVRLSRLKLQVTFVDAEDFA